MQGTQMGTATTSMRAPSGLAQSYHRKTEAYGMAQRSLRRLARRGDADAAMKLVGVIGQAQNEGIGVGGSRKSEEYGSDTKGL